MFFFNSTMASMSSCEGPFGPGFSFLPTRNATNRELNQLTHTIAHRLARYLERQGLLEWNDRYAVVNGRSP
jgi:hypothetical protein